MSNGCADTSIQKGGVPGIPGCLEHSSMIWDAIQRAKTGKLELHVIWLDLANAYGAVPHSLLWKALETYHVPTGIIGILREYFKNFKMRFRTPSFTTRWTPLEVGIAMGCSVSPILFVLAMQVLLKATEFEAGEASLGQGVHIPSLKAFMDYIIVIADAVAKAQQVLDRLDSLVSWSWMKFKPSKSRSLSLRKGKVDANAIFHISGQVIPKVSEQPVKSLGRWYDCSLKDTAQSKEVIKAASDGLATINATKLQGKFKAWILQFMLIPKLLWPLQVYEIGMSAVETTERKINRYTRKWLGLTPGLSTMALYSRSAKLRLPFKAITEEFKVGKVRLQMMLKHSSDRSISGIEPEVKTGRKWKASEAVKEAEDAARLKEVMGAVQTHRHGIGYGAEKRVWWSKASGKERRDMVIEEVRRQAEDDRVQVAVQQGQQGQWTTWESAVQRSLSWNDIWHLAPLRLSFIIRSMYDQLPSGDNLARWKVSQDDKCALCGGVQTLNHVLASCKEALGSGRYTWRHNQVLRKLAEAVNVARMRANEKAMKQAPAHRWLRSGAGPAGKSMPPTLPKESILEVANEWKMATDLPGMKEYPDVIKESGLRPDMVLISKSSRTVVIVELTVPYESNMSESHEFKMAKYEGLAREIRQKGYGTQLFAVEVGARGLAGGTVYSLLH